MAATGVGPEIPVTDSAVRDGAQSRWLSSLVAYREIALVVVLTMLAAGLRLWRLTTVPYGLRGDVAEVQLDTQRILDEGWIGPYSPAAAGYPTAVNYVAAPFLAVFGHGVLASLLPMALIGAATTPLAYLVLRNAAGWRAGVCGSLLLTLSLWHLQLSRIGFPVIGWPFVELAAILALQLGIRTRHWAWFVVSGLFVGVSIWVYPAAVAFVVAMGFVIAAWLTWRLWSERSADSLTAVRDLMLMLILGLSALLAAWPMIEYELGDGSTSSRFEDAYVFSDERRERCLTSDPASWDDACRWATADGLRGRVDVVFDRSRQLFESLTTTPRPDAIDALGAKPPVGQVAMYLAVAGIALSVARWRRMQLAFAIALVSLPLIVLFTVLTIDGQYRRSFGLMPFLAMFGGLTLGLIWEWADGQRPRVRAPALAGIAAMLALVGAHSIGFYYDDFERTQTARRVFFPEMRRASEYLDSIGHPYVYLYSDRAGIAHDSRKVIAPDIAGGEDRGAKFTPDESGRVRYDLELASRLAEPLRREPDGAVFLLMDGYGDPSSNKYALDEIEARYPGGRTVGYYDEYWRSWDFVAYYLPADLLETYAGAEGVEYRASSAP